MHHLVIALLCFGAVGVLGAAGPWRADPEVAERLGRRRPGRVYDESRVPAYALPEALRSRDGRVVRDAAGWAGRRAEILESFRGEMFGRSPGKPERLTFEVVAEDPGAMGGAATLRRVMIRSGHRGRTHAFELVLFVPNAAKGPVPTFLLINNRGAENTDPTRARKSPFWPAEEVVARGYGVAAFQNGDVAPDDRVRFREGAIGMFEGETRAADRPGDAWGALAAWAWGASRAMDYLETDGRVDATRVAVVGHSRGGKTALWAAAEDGRFAMAVSNNSGSCGAALSRRRYGERIRETDGNTHWFCGNFRRYHDREDELPFDQHMLIGLVAPRAVYVASASEDLSADPRGEFLGLAHASDVYGLWGHGPVPADGMPGVDEPAAWGPRGYHVRSGGHDLTVYDWERFMDFADRLWPWGEGRR